MLDLERNKQMDHDGQVIALDQVRDSTMKKAVKDYVLFEERALKSNVPAEYRIVREQIAADVESTPPYVLEEQGYENPEVLVAERVFRRKFENPSAAVHALQYCDAVVAVKEMEETMAVFRGGEDEDNDQLDMVAEFFNISREELIAWMGQPDMAGQPGADLVLRQQTRAEAMSIIAQNLRMDVMEIYGRMLVEDTAVIEASRGIVDIFLRRKPKAEEMFRQTNEWVENYFGDQRNINLLLLQTRSRRV